MMNAKARFRTVAMLGALAAAAMLSACGSGSQDTAADTSPKAGSAAPGPSGQAPSGSPAPTEVVPTPEPKGTPPKNEQPPPPGSGPRGDRCGGGHPNPACTGVPAGTRLTTLKLNDDGTYKVTKPGQVLDGVHIRGNLLIAAGGVTIRNSLIDGFVINEYGPRFFPFTIANSTVGPADDCLPDPGVGEAKFTATGLHVRGHGDGFRVGGDDVVIRDSYVRLCSKPGFHSDGIQNYLADSTGKRLVFDHNTVDQRNVQEWNATIGLGDSHASDIWVTNNLVMGGAYGIQLRNAHGTLVVRDNRLVNKIWSYGPVASDCKNIDWSGNTLVDIDANYRITKTVGPLRCSN